MEYLSAFLVTTKIAYFMWKIQMSPELKVCVTWFICFWIFFRQGMIVPSFIIVGRLVFSRFLDLRGNLGIVSETRTRKTFSREKKRLAPRIYQAKFYQAAFFWSQQNLYYTFTRNRVKTGESIWKGSITKVL